MNFYNENDPKAAAWLRELIRAGEIAPGIVDERSIVDVQPDDLTKYKQCHFFAGIGGWPLALDLSGWPATRTVWTGSCPCQPFSLAGKQLGGSDERHLWPAFFRLIRQCRPEFVFGEQVASAIGKGWLDGVSADLESEGYACGAAVLGAHSVGGPHIRQRLFWVANSNGGKPGDGNLQRGWQHGQRAQDGGSGGLADAADLRRAQHGRESRQWADAGPCDSAERSGVSRVDHATGARRDGEIGDSEGEAWNKTRMRVSSFGCSTGGVGNAASYDERRQRKSRAIDGREIPAGGSSAWSDYETIPCRDGKSRRIESGTFPLAHGIPGRVGLLRGYGNAIVPQVAAMFIEAACDLIP